MEPKRETPQESLGYVFLREWIKAIPWVLTVFFLVLFFLMGAKNNIKEGIEFTAKQFSREVYSMASNEVVKQDIKEAMQFLSQQASAEIRKILSDPALKQDMKEAIELWYEYKCGKRVPLKVKTVKGSG